MLRATWLGGWVSFRHTPVLYQNGKTYLKTFRPTGSPIILVSSDPWRWYPIPMGTPSAGAKNTRGGKQCKIGRWLLWNVNRKSLVPDWMVSFSMALSDPNLGFKVTVYLQVDYLKNGVF